MSANPRDFMLSGSETPQPAPKMRFRRPWIRLRPRRARDLTAEFELERSLLHSLFGVPCEAVAENVADGGVLFRVSGILCEFAVVRLTGSGHVEIDPARVPFQFYVDWDDFKQCCLGLQRGSASSCGEF
jgi:hypothetical protein